MNKIVAALSTFKATLIAVTSNAALDDAAKSALISEAIMVYVAALAAADAPAPATP